MTLKHPPAIPDYLGIQFQYPIDKTMVQGIALQGRYIPAQGNALGVMAVAKASPEGA